MKYRQVDVGANGVVYDLGTPIGDIEEGTHPPLFIQIHEPPNLLKTIHIGGKPGFQWGEHIESRRFHIPKDRDAIKDAKMGCVQWAISNNMWHGTIQEAM